MQDDCSELAGNVKSSHFGVRGLATALQKGQEEVICVAS
jgi:hypothetical protein